MTQHRTNADNTPIIDFRELVSGASGEGLEHLVRGLGTAMGLSPVWSGRGADGGRDLLFTEVLSGTLSTEKITWLVSCKDKARGGGSVTENDLPRPGISDKVKQHKANGFLLVTTTTVSTAAKSLLDSLDKSAGGEIHTLVWDSPELTKMLLLPANRELLRQSLPSSYERLVGQISPENALSILREQLPDRVFREVRRLVRPYIIPLPDGADIWPFDPEEAAVINEVIGHLLIEHGAEVAADSTANIGSEAFVALANFLIEKHVKEARDYLHAIICRRLEPEIRINAAQLLIDHYELDSEQFLDIITHLSVHELKSIYGNEIAIFVAEELTCNTAAYDLHQSLDILSSRTQIDYIGIESLSIAVEIEDRRIRFWGDIDVDTTFEFEHEDMRGQSFPGKFSGYYTEKGAFVEQASVDTRSSFEGKPNP